MVNRICERIKRYNFKEILNIIDYRYGLGALENIFSSNWINPFLTIYINFRSFPLKQAWKMPIWVFGRPRIYALSGSMKITGKVSFGMIRFNNTHYGAPSIMSLQSELSNLGTIVFCGKGRIGTGTKIYVYRDAELIIGENFKIMDMCNIGCYERISIGAQSWIVHRCQVLDSNYHYVANFSKGIVLKYRNPITIGRGCWICNSSTITGGSNLPDFTIVASNSLVSKDFSTLPKSSLIGGIPAKLIASGVRRVENLNLEREISRYYNQYPDGMFHLDEKITMDFCSHLG